MKNIGLQRQGEYLTLNWENLRQSLSSEASATMPRAGSHPHIVRQWLLAHSIFPKKWVNQLFSIGGIKWDNENLLLLAFPKIDLATSSIYQTVKFFKEKDRIDILYEDDHCLVVYKPSGMPVHASRAGEVYTLDTAVAYHMMTKSDPILVRHIHRLDDETSGPVLYSKHDLAQWILDEDMRSKSIQRVYAAVVHGSLKLEKGMIDSPIGKDRHHSKRRVVSPNGDDARTHYIRLKHNQNYSYVQLQLETGRTHQIRVHMSSIGHPLVGDSLYGGKTELLTHQALHGLYLEFNHPITDEWMHVEAPLPNWLKQLMKHCF